MITKETAFKTISDLVDRFEEQYDSYKDSNYNETLTRKDFIDPFFTALGWDMDNRQGFAEAYREVIHEDRVKVGDKLKAPDYSFKLSGGKKLFFVEAKKPSVFVKGEIVPAYQLRRYGWSAKMPISIITDFEEFAVYDCTVKPDPTDKASTARIKYLTYKDYLNEFEFLWDTFSKERVLKGSFDKYVVSDTHKKGTATVDKEFLNSLDSWRMYLATSISWNNKKLDEDEINFVVQQTIDRIIFLRIAEDRRIEPYGNLKLAIKQGDYYKNLFHLFENADDKYNSGIFDFKKDKLSKNLTIDNKVIKNIITELYYPESPYEFSELSVEILGCAYEQFLGKVIRITPSHHAKIEDKPEVRKAGGVYYTPQYIVEYIVKNTVGKLIEGKNPGEIEKIKIVDPACGSGSFLIGAYQYLLDYHKHYYSNNGKPSKGKKESPLTPEGNLTTSEKKKILLNNIFGVDIDVNAVEVTKLSLLLKCMEGETEASISNQMKMFHERVLPTLDNNIKDGNSLVDTDFYSSQLDFGEEKKIKPFNWPKGFPAVFNQGGFDIVIGNPPYVSAKNMTELFNIERDYLSKSINYKTLFQKWDLYIPFIEKGIQLLKTNGVISMIVPFPFLNQIYGQLVRSEIVEKHCLFEIVDLSDVKVFKDAVVTNTIFFVQKNNLTDKIKISFIEEKKSEIIIEKCQLSKNELVNINDKNIIWNTNNNPIISLQENKFNLFGDICFISKGMVLNADEIKAKGEFIKKDLINSIETKIHIKKYIEAKNIDRYKINKTQFLEWNTKRVPSKLSRPTFIELYENPKILINKLGTLKCTFDNQSIYCDQTIRVAILWKNLKLVQNNSINNSVSRYSTKNRKELEELSNEYNEFFILGILNSKFANYQLDKIRGKNNIDINPEYLKNIPIPKINKTSKQDHDQILNYVKQLLQLNKDLITSTLSTKKDQLQGKIDFCENKINEIVFQLYGLSKKEIATIENELKK